MVEHPSIAENCEMLGSLGMATAKIDVDSRGHVTEETLSKTLSKLNEAPILAAIMAVNNETGSANDIAALVKKIRASYSRPVHIHSDMVQALGKVPLDLPGADLDSASFSAHKIGGPRGIGILYLRKPLNVLSLGGGQESGIRSGTENVAGAVGFAHCINKYASLQNENFPAIYENAVSVMKHLIVELKTLPRATILPASRSECDKRFSPFILQVSFAGIPGEVMARALNDKGFAVSTGSACHSKDNSRPVLDAMGIDKKIAFEGVRISIGYTTTLTQIDLLLNAIKSVLEIL
jgi:cysteine desulfurase